MSFLISRPHFRRRPTLCHGVKLSHIVGSDATRAMQLDDERVLLSSFQIRGPQDTINQAGTARGCEAAALKLINRNTSRKRSINWRWIGDQLKGLRASTTGQSD